MAAGHRSEEVEEWQVPAGGEWEWQEAVGRDRQTRLEHQQECAAAVAAERVLQMMVLAGGGFSGRLGRVQPACRSRQGGRQTGRQAGAW